MHESVSNYSAQLIHSLNVGFIVQNYARFITTLLPPLTRLFPSSIPEKYVAHQSKSEKKKYFAHSSLCSIHVRILKTTEITAITQRTGSLWNAIFLCKTAKTLSSHCSMRHCLSHGCWKVTCNLFRRESSRNITVFFFTLASLVVRRE